MRIELHDEFQKLSGKVLIDPAKRPSRVRLTDQEGEVFLDWDIALDDAGQLRRCLSCGCTDLFHEKDFPAIVGVLVVFNYAGLLVGLFGGAENFFVWLTMIVLLVAGLVFLIGSKMRLVCYRCRTSYYDLPIARYHRSWDRAIADRHPLQVPAPIKPPIGEDLESFELDESSFPTKEPVA